MNAPWVNIIGSSIELLPVEYVVEGGLVRSTLRSRKLARGGTVVSESSIEGATIICSDELQALSTCCELNRLEQLRR